MLKTISQNSTVVREKSSSSLSLKRADSGHQSENSGEMTKETYSKRTLSPIATHRTIVINRTNNQIPSSTINKSYNFESMSSPVNTNVTGEINHFKRDREKDKKDMQNLNEKLAGYIEQVRFLEAQNKKQGAELANLKDKWGKETEEVKTMYNVEMQNLQALLNEAEKNRGKVELDLNNLENELKRSQDNLEVSRNNEEELRAKLEKCNEALSEAEALTSMLKKRIANLEELKARDKKEIYKLRDEIQSIHVDLNAETTKYLNAECELQGKKDELEFMKQVHQAQLNELSALAYRDTTKDNKDFWKAEIAVAMQDIQSDYEERMQMLRMSIESQCTMKMQDIKSENGKLIIELNSIKEENKRIKNDWGSSKSRIPDLENKIAALERALADLKHEFEEANRDHALEMSNKAKDLEDADAMIQELSSKLKTLLDDKLSLQIEIAAYRKLLEGEETRWTEKSSTVVAHENGLVNSGLKSFVNLVQQETIVKKKSQEVNAVSTSEISAKTTFQRSTKGNISVQECSPDGKFIILENVGNKKEDIGDMVIQRDIDHGRQVIKFTIPKRTSLDPIKTLKIWAKGQKPHGSSDLEIPELNWGIGVDVHTTLLNPTGEERASHTQKTTMVKN